MALITFIRVDGSSIAIILASARGLPRTNDECPTTSNVPAAEYDGTGFLMPVNRQSEKVPPFALVSRDGRILRYVVPTPGLNLQRYERQEVGVFGSTRNAEGVAGGLLVAERIVELDRHR